jgi:hypothetical protein
MSQGIGKITATEMARNAQIDPGFFREILRDENFEWHKRNTRWTVEINSEAHRAMQRVLSKISPVKKPPIRDSASLRGNEK